MTSNANPVLITLISLIYAQPGPSQGPGRGGPTRVGDRSGKRAALFAAVGEPPPVPFGSGHRCQPRSADRSWIRLTPEERLPANQAAEIVGRVDAATNELAAQVGLQAGR